MSELRKLPESFRSQVRNRNTNTDPEGSQKGKKGSSEELDVLSGGLEASARDLNPVCGSKNS